MHWYVDPTVDFAKYRRLDYTTVYSCPHTQETCVKWSTGGGKKQVLNLFGKFDRDW